MGLARAVVANVFGWAQVYHHWNLPCDSAIRFPIARALLTKTKEEVTEARVEIMLEAGVVSLIHLSDMGKEFDNHLALELESLLGGRHVFGLA